MNSFLILAALLRAPPGALAARSEGDLQAVLEKDDCDPLTFVDFSVGGGWFSKDLKKAAERCEATYGHRGKMRTGTLFEGRWMQERCKEGAAIGRELCKQADNNGSAVAPEEIVDHFMAGGHSQAAKAWMKKAQEWCGESPHPRWTGFRNCYHACQYRHMDCQQSKFFKCLPCNQDDKDCEGVRAVDSKGRLQAEFDVPVAKGYSFLDACVQGCSLYAAIKRGGGKGGPACAKGTGPIQMTHTGFTKRWENSCKSSGGTIDAPVCWCEAEDSTCIGKDGRPSDSVRPSPGCLFNRDRWRFGFMEECEGCTCS